MGQARALGSSNFIFKMQLTELISFRWKFYNSNITLRSPMVNFLWRLFFFWLSDTVPVFFKPGSEGASCVTMDYLSSSWMGADEGRPQSQATLAELEGCADFHFKPRGPAANCREAMAAVV